MPDHRHDRCDDKMIQMWAIYISFLIGSIVLLIISGRNNAHSLDSLGFPSESSEDMVIQKISVSKRFAHTDPNLDPTFSFKILHELYNGEQFPSVYKIPQCGPISA
jgi:hypothetical protein